MCRIPNYDEVYAAQSCGIKFVSNVEQEWQDNGFLWVLWFPPPIKWTTGYMYITDILLIFALNSSNHNLLQVIAPLECR